MRIIIIALFAFTAAITTQAQTALPTGILNYGQQNAFNQNHPVNDSNRVQKKWSISMYSGITAGMAFYNHTGTSFLLPSIGLQLNRRLNNNLYAFAAVSAGPAFFYGNRSFISTDYHNNFMTMPGFNTSQLGLNTGIQAGLMYVNDAKTFSISGSIGVSNSSYPYHPAIQRHSTAIAAKQ